MASEREATSAPPAGRPTGPGALIGPRGTPAPATATLQLTVRGYPLAAGNGTILVTPVPTGPQGGSGTPAGPTPYS